MLITIINSENKIISMFGFGGWDKKVKNLRKKWDRVREKSLEKEGPIRAKLLEKEDQVEQNLRLLEERELHKVERSRMYAEVETIVGEIKKLLEAKPGELHGVAERVRGKQ